MAIMQTPGAANPALAPYAQAQAQAMTDNRPAVRRQPMPPPIMDYRGADPVRAYQGMANATINGTGATTLGAMVGAPRPAPAPAPVNPVQFINKPALTPSPSEKLSQANTAFMPPALPPLTQAGANRPNLTPTVAPPLVAPAGPSPTLSGATSPAANYQPPSAVSSPQARMAAALLGARGTSTAPRTATPIMTATPADATFASARNPLTGVTPSSKVNQAATAFGGTTTQRTAPTGFMAYSAADPSRALKMMRGY